MIRIVITVTTAREILDVDCSLKACPHQEPLSGNNVSQLFANNLKNCLENHVSLLQANSFQTVCKQCFLSAPKLSVVIRMLGNKKVAVVTSILFGTLTAFKERQDQEKKRNG